MKRMTVKTPIFKGDNKKRITGTADGWIDAEVVRGVVSGTSVHATVQDSSVKGQGMKERSGNCMTVLHLDGGGNVIVMGTPVAILKQIDETLAAEGGKPPAPAEQPSGDLDGVN